MRVNVERDKKDYAQFYKEAKYKLRQEQKEREPIRRRWHSFDEDVLREWYDDFGPMSDFDSEISHESFPHKKEKLKNAEYLARLELFRQNLKFRYRFNNAYTQKKDNKPGRKPDNKNVTRRTQTYERDIAIGYDPFDMEGEHYLTDEDKAIEYDPQFAKDLLKNLIDNISDLPSSNPHDSDEDFEGRRKRKVVTRENFDIDDIMGEFEIDDMGNIILNPHKLRDNMNRKVNKHGYLVDDRGNIINQEGDIVFQFMELDSDEEIP